MGAEKQKPGQEQQAQPPAQKQLGAAGRQRAPLPLRAGDYARLGVPLSSMPPEAVLAMASQLGNSALLALLKETEAIPTVKFVFAHHLDGVVNDICPAYPALTDPSGLAPSSEPLTPFMTSNIADRADMGVTHE